MFGVISDALSRLPWNTDSVCNQRNTLRVCGLAAFLSAIVATFIIWENYDQNKKSALRSLERSAHLLEKSFTYALEATHTLLKQIYADALRAPTPFPNSERILLQETIARNLETFPHLARITVIDGKNTTLADSAFPENVGQPFTSSDYRSYACVPPPPKDRLRIGHIRQSAFLRDWEKSPQLGSYTDSITVIPIALLEKSDTFPKRRIIAEIKASWIFEFWRLYKLITLKTFQYCARTSQSIRRQQPFQHLVLLQSQHFYQKTLWRTSETHFYTQNVRKIPSGNFAYNNRGHNQRDMAP